MSVVTVNVALLYTYVALLYMHVLVDEKHCSVHGNGECCIVIHACVIR